MSHKLAIALNVAKMARKKKAKKMSEGGEIKKENYSSSQQPQGAFGKAKLPGKEKAAASMKKAFGFSQGGQVRESMAQSIMRKRRKEMGVDDHETDLQETNGMEHGNYMDERNSDVLEEKQYDLDQLSPQPEDSNEMGDDIESDINDMVARIRRKLRMRSGM